MDPLAIAAVAGMEAKETVAVRRVALVDESNIAMKVLDVSEAWEPPEGVRVIETAHASQGDVYDEKDGFTRDIEAAKPQPLPVEPTAEEKVAALLGRHGLTVEEFAAVIVAVKT